MVFLLHGLASIPRPRETRLSNVRALKSNNFHARERRLWKFAPVGAASSRHLSCALAAGFAISGRAALL
jgi:hypothetical protein